MTYDIYINDAIGWPISARYIRGELKRFEGRPVTVYINSLGGSVPDALDIYQQLRDHGQATVVIFGMTASAATIIACGAQRILMSDKALLLIHRASLWKDEWGQMNAEEIAQAIRRFEKSKDTLEKLDGIIANIYAQRSGGRAKPEDFASTMGEELWLTAAQAREMGLVDDIIEEGEAPSGQALSRARFQAMALPLPKSLTTAPSTLKSTAPATAQAPSGGQTAHTKSPAGNDNEDCPAGNGSEAAPAPTQPAAPTDERQRSRLAAAVQRIIEALRPDTPPADQTPDTNDTGKKNPDNNHTNTTNTMNKEQTPNQAPQALAALCTLLAVQTLAAANDGSITLTAAQAEAIDNELSRLANVENEANTLRTDKQNLEQQIKDLKDADGAETDHIEGGKDTDKPEDAATRVRAGYDLIKGLL